MKDVVSNPDGDATVARTLAEVEVADAAHLKKCQELLRSMQQPSWDEIARQKVNLERRQELMARMRKQHPDKNEDEHFELLRHELIHVLKGRHPDKTEAECFEMLRPMSWSQCYLLMERRGRDDQAWKWGRPDVGIPAVRGCVSDYGTPSYGGGLFDQPYLPPPSSRAGGPAPAAGPPRAVWYEK